MGGATDISLPRVDCGRCRDCFHVSTGTAFSSAREELCLRLRVFFVPGSCARSGPALSESSTITVTLGPSTLSNQASMVLIESQEIVLVIGDGEGGNAASIGLAASFVLWILAGIGLAVNARWHFSCEYCDSMMQLWVCRTPVVHTFQAASMSYAAGSCRKTYRNEVCP